MWNHTSNPNVGNYSPHPNVCDPTTDYAGGGMGRVWEHKNKDNTRLYVTGGYRQVRQCSDPDMSGLGANVTLIHEHRKE